MNSLLCALSIAVIFVVIYMRLKWSSRERYVYTPQNHRYISDMDKKLSNQSEIWEIPQNHFQCQKLDEVALSDGRCASVNPDCGCGCYKRFPEYDRHGNVVRYIPEHSLD